MNRHGNATKRVGAPIVCRALSSRMWRPLSHVRICRWKATVLPSQTRYARSELPFRYGCGVMSLTDVLYWSGFSVPDHLQEFIYACQQGNIDVVRHLWNPDWLEELNKLKREDTCHPLLTAVHHLRPVVVGFLCEQVCWHAGGWFKFLGRLDLVSPLHHFFSCVCRVYLRFEWELSIRTPGMAWL